MTKLLVSPVGLDVRSFEIEGELTSRFTDDGLIYYVAGESFPAEIATVLEGEAERYE